MADSAEMIQAAPLVCAHCGAAGYSTAFGRCPEKRRMDELGVCFRCAMWSIRAEETHGTVIGGRVYSVGNRPKGAPLAGMAGRRFDIEYFDGRRVTTYDLWAGDEVPERYREKIPNTACFLGGAGAVKVGDTTCWQPSREVLSGNAETETGTDEW
jgi:hypothetical protein